MIDLFTLTLIISLLGFSMILMWETITTMIERKRILVLVPFLMIGIVLCFEATFLFYGFSNHVIQITSSYIQVLLLIWVLLVILKEND